MGLSLQVGLLADLLQHDKESATILQRQLGDLNRHLESVGISLHREPEECEVWSADMFGYSGLHTLRRIAAHLDAGRSLPTPGDSDNSQDTIADAYFSEIVSGPPGFWKRLGRSLPKFTRKYDHLIAHSDCEGFYLPLDFPEVLLVDETLSVPGCMVGSSSRLLAEVTSLASVLGIPQDLHSQSEILWEAADSQGEGESLWQRYGIESISCVVLQEGCRKSLETGAALVFC
jgi:hypothetical protein